MKFGDVPTIDPVAAGSPTGTQGIVGSFTSIVNSAAIAGLTTDFTFTAAVVAGRAYTFNFRSQFISANYSYYVGITDGSEAWTIAYMPISAAANWIGNYSHSAGGALEQLYLPSTSGTKTFSIVLQTKTGSGTANSTFVATANANRQFWLKDLGQYPVTGSDLGLVGYAQATSNSVITVPGADTLSVTATLQPTGRYRAVYRGQFSSNAGTSGHIRESNTDYYVWSMGGVLTNALLSGQLIMPVYTGVKTFTGFHNGSGSVTAQGHHDYPRQLWLERIG